MSDYDVIIFSDVEGKLFQLAPDFFDREEFGKRILTYPDRAKLTNEAVKAGKGLMMLGGWYSFTGEIGKGGWGRTPLREVSSGKHYLHTSPVFLNSSNLSNLSNSSPLNPSKKQHKPREPYKPLEFLPLSFAVPLSQHPEE